MKFVESGLGSGTLVEEEPDLPRMPETRPHFEKAAAYGAYDGELRELIHLLKYEQVTPAAACWDECWRKRFTSWAIGADSILVIPGPLHSLETARSADLIRRS